MVNEDCSVKLCDYGLARSITGVESAEMILKRTEEEEESEQRVDTEGDVSMNSQASVPEEKTQEEKKDDMRSRLIKTKD